MSLIHHDPGVTVFVGISKILVSLRMIRKEARHLSLAAKNARVLALRAGEQARGFQAITHFIDEFANSTLHTSVKIDEHSKALFKVALENVRAMHFIEALHKAHKKVAAPYREHPVFDKEFIDERQHLKRHIIDLRSALEVIQQHIRAAEYISVTSRTEAVQAGQFSANLQSVSDYITQSAVAIRTAVKECMDQLTEVEVQAL